VILVVLSFCACDTYDKSPSGLRRTRRSGFYPCPDESVKLLFCGGIWFATEAGAQAQPTSVSVAICVRICWSDRPTGKIGCAKIRGVKLGPVTLAGPSMRPACSGGIPAVVSRQCLPCLESEIFGKRRWRTGVDAACPEIGCI
jgi:hypothetical protein